MYKIKNLIGHCLQIRGLGHGYNVGKCGCRHGTEAVAESLHPDLQAGGRKNKTGPDVGLFKDLQRQSPPAKITVINLN